MRHGRTGFNAERRFQGRLDALLDEEGRKQATAAGVALAAGAYGAAFDAFLTSPLKRASETAELIGAEIGMIPSPLDLLMEIDCGDISGLLVDEAILKYPEVMNRLGPDWWGTSYPNGQSHSSYEKENVHPAIRRICEIEEGKSVLAVTHGGFIRTVIMAVLELGGERPFLKHRIDNCGITTIEVDGFDDEGRPHGRLREMNLRVTPGIGEVADVYMKGAALR